MHAIFTQMKKITMAEEKKDHVTGRVSEKAIRNISALADCFGWSFNQTLGFAMENLTPERIFEFIKANQTELNKQTKQ